jgi:hypothetical protein
VVAACSLLSLKKLINIRSNARKLNVSAHVSEKYYGISATNGKFFLYKNNSTESEYVNNTQ